MAKAGGNGGRGGGSGLSSSEKTALVSAWGTGSVITYASGLSPEEKQNFYRILRIASEGYDKGITNSMVRAAANHISKTWSNFIAKYGGVDNFGNKYKPGDRIYWDRNKGSFREDVIRRLVP